MSSNNAYATAFKLLTLGYSVIPSGAGPDRKAPAVEWQTRQQTPADENELQDYQDRLNPPLWGIVTGAVSGVVVADADDAEARRILESEGLQPHILTPRDLLYGRRGQRAGAAGPHLRAREEAQAPVLLRHQPVRGESPH